MDRCSCGYVCKSFADILRHIELMNERDADGHQVEIEEPSKIAEELGC